MLDKLIKAPTSEWLLEIHNYRIHSVHRNVNNNHIANEDSSFNVYVNGEVMVVKEEESSLKWNLRDSKQPLT